MYEVNNNDQYAISTKSKQPWWLNMLHPKYLWMTWSLDSLELIYQLAVISLYNKQSYVVLFCCYSKEFHYKIILGMVDSEDNPMFMNVLKCAIAISHS